MKKLLVVTLITAFGLFTLNGCSTIAGAGKDIQDVGGAITDKAERAKKKE
ncbi:hypothetical protein GCM10009133_32760 [Cocleimonas flava]|jgi:predicted small secreted protein|uniref:Putative small secreted protein n=1 Tax=Cocleimonas flava TaxID=634765 RepID=A0A4R1FAD8_9GAMM|nr:MULTISPECIES: entericidin A/B family lipoprotein [Cocleimonas]MEB8431191.1 entericidin A/B family lipoprotein [Cocleimonas sp. KMM 6892]MEC4714037.1 entericidin A/B family lipoprotein [Cocleimonas sp. KMM 6895]MEC4743368.1 entericidin A/B family lipoprotein [Cocleimonas sp. KMM 6896]TCJ88878.1 putative small secreted protein [Cocleimonas flava]